MKPRYFSFNQYLRQVFGQRVHRISLDAGFECPNLNGALSQDGCIFCNNQGFSRYALSQESLSEQISKSVSFYQKRMGVEKFIAYFQAFSSTYADLEVLEKTYSVIRKFPQIVGLFISTRPDCVDQEKIKLIASYKKDYLVWMEYGLQTTHDHLLKKINRNHTYQDFLKALSLTRSHDISTGVHMILGLPQATREDMITDITRICALDIQGIKFHLLHVLKDTKLEKDYLSGKVSLFEQDSYCRLLADIIELVPDHIVMLRLVSDADKSYLVAPQWIKEKAKFLEKFNAELARRNSWQGINAKNHPPKSASL